jgi:hypothetical protein
VGSRNESDGPGTWTEPRQTPVLRSMKQVAASRAIALMPMNALAHSVTRRADEGGSIREQHLSTEAAPRSRRAVQVGILVWLIVMILPIFTSVAQASPIYINSAWPPSGLLVAGVASELCWPPRPGNVPWDSPSSLARFSGSLALS